MAATGAVGRAYRRRMFIDVGAVGQVDEDGVHVLHICDDDGQVGQCRQRSGLVLILGRHTEKARVHSVGLEGCCENMHSCIGRCWVIPVFANTHINSYIPTESLKSTTALWRSLRCSRKWTSWRAGGVTSGGWAEADLMALGLWPRTTSTECWDGGH